MLRIVRVRARLLPAVAIAVSLGFTAAHAAPAGATAPATAKRARAARAATPTAAIPARRMGINLLDNPGFEKPLAGHPWMPANWDTSDSGLPTVFFGRDTFAVHGGQYAVNVANTSTVIPVWHNWSQQVLVGPDAWGKDAVFSVWTRANGLQGRAYVLLQAYRDSVGKMARLWHMDRDVAARKLQINKVDDPILDLGWKREYFSTSEDNWIKRTVRVFVPPSVNVLYVRCGLFGTGQVIFDDASLTLEPAQPPVEPALRANLLADPGFEGDGNGWEYAMPPYDGMRVERDTTLAHGGRASIAASGNMAGFMQVRTGVCQNFSDRALAGKHVRIAGWFKTDSLKSTAFLKIYAHTLHGMVQSDTPAELFSSTHDWTPSSVEMDLPPDTYEVWAWWMYNAPAAGVVHFDDCDFEVLGPAGTAEAKPATKAVVKP
ncbi:MAG TPA: hypothetical protein VFK69_07900 [Candidatus Eisenbacteria bacterium]|nr:hypothetical protein [Candidatus Eisenbacteria bacterium]